MITRDFVSRTTVSEKAVGERTFQKSVSVPTARSEHHDTPDSADACWRPVAKTTPGRQTVVEDRGTGGLAPPAAHQSDAVGLPVPERTGSPLLGLHT